MFGAVASSKESLAHVLSTPEGGKAAVLMVGGIPEMDNFHDKQVNLVRLLVESWSRDHCNHR